MPVIYFSVFNLWTPMVCFLANLLESSNCGNIAEIYKVDFSKTERCVVEELPKPIVLKINN
jgi:hypothetical protein